MITYNIDDLFFSVNDIYSAFDEGEITYQEAEVILKRCCASFLKGEVIDEDL